MTGNEAKVRSIESLEAFRASLIVFITKSRRAMEQVTEEVNRTRVWIQYDQKVYWQAELKRRTAAMHRAEQELVTARFSTLRSTTTVQEQAVRRGRQAVAEAEEKIRRVKQWGNSYDGLVDPHLKKIENLRSYIDHDLTKAVAYLAETERTLLAYADNSFALDNAPPPAEAENQETAS